MKQIVTFFLFLPVILNAQHFSTSTFEVKPFPEMPTKVKALEEKLQENALYNSLPSDKKEWFYWTNYSRQNPQKFWDSVVVPVLKTFPNLSSKYSNSLKKDLYSSIPLPFVLPDTKLLQLAQNHAQDLGMKKSNPSHTSTNGKTFQQRMIEAQINRCAAENISFGPSNAIMALVLLYIDENLPDLGHRKNLLNPAFTSMGIGTFNYPNSMIMIIQDLACDQAL